MAKRKTTNKKRKKTQDNKELLRQLSTSSGKNAVKYIVIVLGIFALMYLLTLLILKKSSTDYITKEKDTTSIQYSEILAGTSFDKKDDEYFVIFYDKSEENSKAETIYSDYKAKDDHKTIYYVDLSSKLNKSVVSNESNSSATKAEELKIKGTTLIKFVDNQIDDYIEGEDEISKYLGIED